MDDSKLTPLEMFQELMRLGHAVPASREPSRLNEPTAYITVASTLAFSTPDIPGDTGEKRKPNAKLGTRSKRNKKRNKRSRNR